MSEAEYMEDEEDYLEEGCHCLIKEQEGER